jgi:hypothetical protein
MCFYSVAAIVIFTFCFATMCIISTFGFIDTTPVTERNIVEGSGRELFSLMLLLRWREDNL